MGGDFVLLQYLHSFFGLNSIYIRLCVKMSILLFKKVILYIILFYFTIHLIFYFFTLPFKYSFFYSFFTIYLRECAKKKKKVIK